MNTTRRLAITVQVGFGDESNEVNMVLTLSPDGVILEAEVEKPGRGRGRGMLVEINPNVATWMLGGPSQELRNRLLNQLEEQNFIGG